MISIHLSELLEREVEGRHRRRIVEDLGRGQQVLEQIMRPFFKKLEYGSNNEVQRYWPLEKSRGIVLDPKRQFGKPIHAKSGVPTRALYDACRADESQDERMVANWFNVTVATVRSAIQFEKSIQQ